MHDNACRGGREWVLKEIKMFCRMVSAVLSDSSSPAPVEKSRSRHHGICVGGVKEREKRGKKCHIVI